MQWFFASDRVHYSRWLPLHIRDMKELIVRYSGMHSTFFDGRFVGRKTSRYSSAIILHQAHEQHNDLIKEDGRVVGLTKNPNARHRWILVGTEVARVIEAFEASFHYLHKVEDKRNGGCHYGQTNAMNLSVAHARKGVQTDANI